MISNIKSQLMLCYPHLFTTFIQPVLTKRLTKNSLEWRIRNLPYPIETYSVTASPEDCSITVRTTNKKYFKKIQIPELTRCELLTDQQLISIQHQHNTLIITVSFYCLYSIEGKFFLLISEICQETHYHSFNYAFHNP